MSKYVFKSSAAEIYLLLGAFFALCAAVAVMSLGMALLSRRREANEARREKE